jgi:hypothetical protein
LAGVEMDDIFTLQDDIASTVFWYQTEPHHVFPVFPNKDALEVN